MVNYLDPQEDPSNPVVPQDSQSSDASKPGLRKAWDAFTSRPENNAALIQFGVAMLQPHAPGQTAVGAAANALGEAGQAADRNITSQRAEADSEAKRGVESAKAAASTSTAASYGRQVDASAAAADKPKGASGVLRQQADFRKWLAKPEDISGLTTDPVLGAIQKTFPNIKTKGDLLADPRALSAAQKLFQAQLTTEPPDEGDSGTPSTATQPAASPATPTTKTFYDSKGVPKQFKLVNGAWVPM